MSWLRRTMRLASRLGNIVLSLTLRRTGRHYEARAVVSGTAFNFDCRSRQSDWRVAFRDLIRILTVRLHDQCLLRVAA